MANQLARVGADESFVGQNLIMDWGNTDETRERGTIAFSNFL